MAMIDHAPEITDEREYAIHVENCRGFLHVGALRSPELALGANVCRRFGGGWATPAAYRRRIV